MALSTWARCVPAGIPEDELVRSRLLARDELDRLIAQAGLVRSGGDRAGPRLVDAAGLETLRHEVVDRVTGWHKANPHVAGIRIHQLRSVVRTPCTGRQLTDALRAALDAGLLVQQGAVWVVRRGGKPVWRYTSAFAGDHPDPAEVVAACRRAAASGP